MVVEDKRGEIINKADSDSVTAGFEFPTDECRRVDAFVDQLHQHVLVSASVHRTGCVRLPMPASAIKRSSPE